jgi:hypothetical protein
VVLEGNRKLLDERRALPTDRGQAGAASATASRIADAIGTRVPLPPEPPGIWTNPFFLGAVGIVLIGGTAATIYITSTPVMDGRARL